MHYWIAERRARYAGKVQVLSENGQLQAGRLDIIEGGDRVEAQDSIRHYIPQREASKAAEPADKTKAKGNAFNTDMTIQSSTLKYGKQKNTITYAGRVTVRSGDLTLSSDTLEAAVTEKGGGIDRATARGRVDIRQKEKEGNRGCGRILSQSAQVRTDGKSRRDPRTGKGPDLRPSIDIPYCR